MPKDYPELNLREVQHCYSSPMVSEAEPDEKTRTRLDFSLILLGESLFVPFELIHEPTLRVKVSRANMMPQGKRYKLVKHGPPASAYEIACIAGPVREPENVGNEESAEPVSRETPEPEAPTWKPPVIED